jgi:hypothetical protein
MGSLRIDIDCFWTPRPEGGGFTRLAAIALHRALVSSECLSYHPRTEIRKRIIQLLLLTFFAALVGLTDRAQNRDRVLVLIHLSRVHLVRGR